MLIHCLLFLLMVSGLRLVTAMSLSCGEASRKHDVVGFYDLVSAAGRDLPVVISENSTTGFKQEIVGGSVTFGEDYRFSWTTRYRYTNGGKVTSDDSSGAGTYKVNGREITLSSETGLSELTGLLNGPSLSVKADVELIYTKRATADE